VGDRTLPVYRVVDFALGLALLATAAIVWLVGRVAVRAGRTTAVIAAMMGQDRIRILHFRLRGEHDVGHRIRLGLGTVAPDPDTGLSRGTGTLRPNDDEGATVIAGVFGTLLWIVVVLVAIGMVIGFVIRGKASK
jgi:hypothetical protein